MSRPKGRHKTGGRQAGTPNKITGTLKDFVANLVDDNRQQIIDDLKALRPKERLAVLERMMQYVLPKQQSVSADVSPDLLCRELVIRHVGSDGEEIFPSSEDQVDIERADFKNN
jgi:hypothetical protein